MTNPVDMIASATAADYERALETVLDDPDVDAVIVDLRPAPLHTRGRRGDRHPGCGSFA